MRDDSDLEATAAAFYSCMRAAGLPVELCKDSQGRLTLVDFPAAADFMWARPDGQLTAGEAYPAAKMDAFFERVERLSQAAADEVSSGSQPSDEPALDFVATGFDYHLEVDGVDRTDVFRECLEATGYDQREVWRSLPFGGADPVWIQADVDAANKWAACARAHGVLGVKDAVRPLTAEDPAPMALLPISLTEAELRRLLEVCPVWTSQQEADSLQVGQEQRRERPGVWGQAPPDVTVPPTIGFDYPGFDGRQEAPDWAQNPPGPEQIAQLNHLSDLDRTLHTIKMQQFYDAGVGGVYPPEVLRGDYRPS
ncbi:MAG: hypothetical protein LBI84_08415 [Propionibacteriaceae bacterium]|nr:hypothetical protein [Propionibacteriaceae bacterium]